MGSKVSQVYVHDNKENDPVPSSVGTSAALGAGLPPT